MATLWRYVQTFNKTNPLVLITKKEKPHSKYVWNTANSGSVNTNAKAQIQLFLGLIRAPCRFIEYLKPIYHQWLNKTSLLKSMENFIWLPALAASSLMSSTAILNAELWKNKAKKHTARLTRKWLETEHFRARDYEQLTNSCPSDAVAPRDLSKAPMKPSLIVMFLASAGSGNKMDSKECLALKKCSRSWRPVLR